MAWYIWIGIVGIIIVILGTVLFLTKKFKKK